MSSTTNSRACVVEDQDEMDGDQGPLPVASSTNRSTSCMDNEGGPLDIAVVDDNSLAASSSALNTESQGGHEYDVVSGSQKQNKHYKAAVFPEYENTLQNWTS